MSACIFKDEIWNLKVKPTHKVVAARGRVAEVVGYFYAVTAHDIRVVMEVFDAEYGNDFDRLMAMSLVSGTPPVAAVVSQHLYLKTA